MNKIILSLLLLFSASLAYGANTSSWVAMNQNSNEKQKVEKTKKQCDAQTGATSIQKKKTACSDSKCTCGCKNAKPKKCTCVKTTKKKLKKSAK